MSIPAPVAKLGEDTGILRRRAAVGAAVFTPEDYEQIKIHFFSCPLCAMAVTDNFMHNLVTRNP